MNEEVTLKVLDELEIVALKALVRQASEGNASAANAAIAACDRIRKTRLSELHARTMAELAEKPLELVGYLAGLGQTLEQVETKLGRKMKAVERVEYQRATDERLLEVRAVEIGRMRRGEADVPRWATKRGG